jgi:hypothetical protein
MMISCSKVRGRHAICRRSWIPGLFPSFYATFDENGPAIAFFEIFRCLTDSGSIIGSGAIKDDFLIFRQSGKSRFELNQRDGALQLHPPAGLFILVGADQLGFPGC